MVIIDSSAKIASDVQIGPFCTIGEDVQIESGTKIISHAVIKGPTVIGKNNCIYQFSTIGDDTPDKKFKGEKTKLIIGDNNIFREFHEEHEYHIEMQHEDNDEFSYAELWLEHVSPFLEISPSEDEFNQALDEQGKEKVVEVLLKEENLNTYLVSHGWTHPLLEKIEIIKEENISYLNE